MVRLPDTAEDAIAAVIPMEKEAFLYNSDRLQKVQVPISSVREMHPDNLIGDITGKK